MQLSVSRKELKLYGDHTRVIGRFFWAGADRARQLIDRVLALPDQEVHDTLRRTLRDFARRHRNINTLFARHLKAALELIPDYHQKVEDTDEERRALIGAYFTHEYSIESAAFFNPSVVPATDQTGLQEGELRLVMSVRAVGEGHLSSIVFRHIILEKDNNVRAEAINPFVGLAGTIRYCRYDKEEFKRRTHEDDRIDETHLQQLLGDLPDNFNHRELFDRYYAQWSAQPRGSAEREALNSLMTVADKYYELKFSLDTDISERVLYPMIDFELRGMEDVRFLQFTQDDGSTIYYGTYTAYNGFMIRPMLLETQDFYNFTVRPVYGNAAVNKNHALFPRKINGHYYILGRTDGINNYLIKSDRLQVWNDPELIMEPLHTWEMYQIGNCGAPIETSEGWLVVTHGVGPMRRYCLGAALLDLNDPSKVIGRLDEPLLSPMEDEREGYVPNVVYSCGSIIHRGELMIPYGISDEAASFATVNLERLLTVLKS